MSDRTAIEWTDHSWSPVWGCTQVSPACDHCYAMTLANRFGHGWNGAPMREFGEHHWNEPLRWNRRAAAAGTRPRVFPSMCDPFDKDWPAGVHLRFFNLISHTPTLTWLLLSKRIGNWRRMVEETWHEAAHHGNDDLAIWLHKWIRGEPPANVWMGSTVINQEEADRDIPKLLATPARVRFLSCEPLLGPLDLTRYIHEGWRFICNWQDGERLHWVITGGESGPQARPANPQWFRDIRDQCAAAGVAYLHKQNGEWVSCSEVAGPGRHFHFPDGATVRRTGKKLAGRTLDGVVHDGFPS